MAEKPRLKKTDEILGSITAESGRKAKKGGAGASADSEKERRSRSAKAPDVKISASPDDFDDELEQSDQQVILPSAQSLAEKLLARDDKRRQLNFEKYELPKREKKQAQSVPKEEPPPVREKVPVPQKKSESAQEKPPVPHEPKDGKPPKAPVREPVSERARSPVPTPTRGSQPAPLELKPADVTPTANVQFEFDDTAAFADPAPAQPEPRHARTSRAASRTSADVQPAPLIPSAPVVSEFSFPSFDDEPAPAPTREFSIGQDGPAENRRARERGRRAAQPETQPERQHMRDIENEPEETPRLQDIPAQTPPVQAEPEQPKIIRPQPVQAPPPEAARLPEAPAESPPPPPPPPEQQARRAPEADTLSDDERERREFLNRISNQFELQFEEKFEQGTLKNRGKVRLPDMPEKDVRSSRHEDDNSLRVEPKPAEQATEPPDEDFFSSIQRQRGRREDGQAPPDDRPLREMFEESGAASGFIAQFERETREEERKRDEDFKETLAEKFERERERYLRELEISQSGDEPPVRPDGIEDLFSPAKQQQRRKLDFQIQPEMHTQAGEQPLPRSPASHAPPSGPRPVTYTRGGMAQPQVPVTGSDPLARAAGVPVSAQTRKKTSEQLLMELGQRPKTAAPAQKPVMQKPLKFTFTTPEEEARAKADKKGKPVREPLLPKEKWPRRIVLIAAAAGLLSIALLLWPLIGYIQFSDSLSSGAESAPGTQEFTGDTLEVYEDRSFTQTAKVNSVLFKNSNVTLKNASVNDYVIVDGVSSAGSIRLQDVSVGSAISIKNTGISSLDLLNVKAGRVVVNNPSAEMTVNISGETEIGVFEVRTPTTVKQFDLSSGAAGVRSMTLTPSEGETAVTANLSGLSLVSLSTAAEDSVLTFEGTQAETMSSEGSLSLSGSGRVVNLSIGAVTGQGAGETDGRKNVSLLVKDVAVTNLNVKSPANLNLTTSVDNVTTSDSISIGGAGSVSTLTLNQRLDGGRLSVDIAGLSIQSIFSNTQSRVNITGSAKVNVLTADASVYILGNKLNRLIANSGDVIYENKPDQVSTAEGVRPPQSVADNPHIDYNAGSQQGTGPPPVGDNSTSCGHSVDSGGFNAGNGSKDSPFEVSTPLQLAHVAAHPDSYFIQTGDVDISTETRFINGFSPICSTGVPFSGQYNGGGFAIINLRISSSDEGVGLFGANKGIIQNVRIVSGEINSTASAKSYVGAIAGVNLDGGSIRSCSSGAAVTGNQFTYTGGIVGLNTGGKVHDCYNSGNISGVDGVGGVVGVNDGSASITGSYNAGIIDGRDYTGSVTGSNSTGSVVANCYYLMDTSPYGIGAGGGTATERTSDELATAQAAADLAAGNESSLWIAGSSSGYPYPTHRMP